MRQNPLTHNVKLAIACDHAGFTLKEALKKFLREKGYEVKDFGAESDKSVDYPDYAHALAKHVAEKDLTFGILMCGSGNGVNMTANRHRGIRAALCWNVELARLARLHNNANVLSLPARFLSDDEAIKIVETFLCTPYEGGRHERRVGKIDG